jgi:histone deacetylase 1/2
MPYSPFQNGVAERYNRTLLEGVRSLLIDSYLPKQYWSFALNHFTTLLNITPTKSQVTPYELIHGVAFQQYAELLPFGTEIWIHILKQHRNKLQPVATKGKFLGIDKQRKGINAITLPNNKLIHTRDYLPDFNGILGKRESQVNQSNFQESFKTSNIEEQTSYDIMEKVQVSKPKRKQQAKSQTPQSTPTKSIPFEYIQFNTPTPTQNRNSISSLLLTPENIKSIGSHIRQDKRYKLKPLGKPGFFKDSSNSVVELQVRSENDLAPKDINAPPLNATRRPTNQNANAVTVNMKTADALDHPEMKIAMNEEMKSQSENNTWTLVKRTQNMKVLPCRWVYAVKENLDGSHKLKARLVIGGHKQEYGVDYNETFAPVVKYHSIRIMIAFATFNNYELHQLDFVTAFLNANLNEQVYMKQPPGFETKDNYICRLNKGLYGLKQAPRQWHIKVKEILAQFGFKSFDSDPSIFINRDWNGDFIMIGIYVDDCIVTGNNLHSIDQFEKQLMKKYKMKHLGNLASILNMKLVRDRYAKISTLTQEDYVDEILTRFNMQDCKPVDTPALKMEEDTTKEDETLFKDQNLYLQAVGSLIYLSTSTRPDIAYAVSKAAEKSQTPTQQDWKSVKRIFRYLKGTKTHGLVFDGNKELKLMGYADADWAGDVETRKSRSGFLFTLCGTPISWNSKKQPTVALSTAEAEYISGSIATQEAIWLSRLISEILNEDIKPVLNLDNQSAILISNNPIIKSRSKHIDIKKYFMREKVESQEISLTYCSTQDMIADIFTKPLQRILFKKFKTMMNIKCKHDMLRGSVDDDATKAQY